MPLASHWRGHFLLFEGRSAPADPAGAGWRILVVVVLLEAVLGPCWHLLECLGVPQPHPAVRVALSLVIANGVFALVFADRIRGLGPGSWIVLAAAGNFLWGFHQELVYRGLLQTELVRRLGPIAGILVANALFAFGPLHFYHLSRPLPWPMMAGIFAIGLFFAVLYHRSRNLWIPAVFHGIGTAWILTAFP